MGPRHRLVEGKYPLEAILSTAERISKERTRDSRAFDEFAERRVPKLKRQGADAKNQKPKLKRQLAVYPETQPADPELTEESGGMIGDFLTSLREESN